MYITVKTQEQEHSNAIKADIVANIVSNLGVHRTIASQTPVSMLYM